MRRTSVALGLLLILLLASAAPAGGCGDKLLVLGRGIRFQNRSAARPAALLAYAPSGSPLAVLLQDPQWLAAMAKGGHRVLSAEDLRQLEGLLRTGRYDLVLAQLSDAAEAQDKARLAPSNPIVLPVVDGSKNEARAAEKQYGCVLKVGSRAGAYLSSIENAVELKNSRDEAAVRARGARKSS